MTLKDEILKYPSLVKASVRARIDRRDTSVSGDIRIEKPESMGLTGIVNEAFRDYVDESGYDTYDAAKDIAMSSFLSFDYDPERIKDKQETHKYFFDNDGLKKHIKEGKLPKRDSFHFNMNRPHERLYEHFHNKELYVNWMKDLNELTTEPKSPTLIKLKSFLESTLENEVAEIEKQIANTKDYVISLTISKDRLSRKNSGLKYELNAENSKGEKLSLNKYIGKGWGKEYVDAVFSDIFNRTSARNTNCLEVRLDELENFSFSSIKKRKFLGDKKDAIDIPEEERLREDLKKIFIASLNLGIEQNMPEIEIRKYSAATHEFSRFIWDLKYFAQMGDYFHRLKNEGYILTTPDILPMEDNLAKIQDGMSFNLMRNMPRNEIITNNIEIGENGKHIYLITGPNKNSKTTFVNMVAGFQAAFQDGWMLPCSSAKMSPKKSIKSFFPEVTNEDDAESRFSYEGVRMKEIFQGIEDFSIVPLDEPFTSANVSKTAPYLQNVIRDVMSQTPNVTYVITSHEHSLIDVVEELEGGQNLKADSKREGENIKLLRKIIPGNSKVMNSDTLLEDIGADPKSLLKYVNNRAKEGKLTLK